MYKTCLYRISLILIGLMLSACSDEVSVNDILGTYFREPFKAGEALVIKILPQHVYQMELTQNGKTRVENGTWTEHFPKSGADAVVLGCPFARLEGFASDSNMAVALDFKVDRSFARLCYGPSYKPYFCYVKQRP
jgi:hypothetical protein